MFACSCIFDNYYQISHIKIFGSLLQPLCLCCKARILHKQIHWGECGGGWGWGGAEGVDVLAAIGVMLRVALVLAAAGGSEISLLHTANDLQQCSAMYRRYTHKLHQHKAQLHVICSSCAHQSHGVISTAAHKVARMGQANTRLCLNTLPPCC